MSVVARPTTGSDQLTIVSNVVDVVARVDIRCSFNVSIENVTFDGVVVSGNLRLISGWWKLQISVVPVGIPAAFVLSFQCGHCGVV